MMEVVVTTGAIRRAKICRQIVTNKPTLSSWDEEERITSGNDTDHDRVPRHGLI